MTAIPGTVGITGLLAPKNAEDTHGTHEDTYGKGGFRSVANSTARDAIPADRRKTGMWVFTEDTNKVYQLEGGITNGDWAEVSFGSAAVTPEFVTSTPRAVASTDHTRTLVGLVPAGLVVTLPSTVTAGTKICISCVGFNVTLLVSGCVFAGPSVLNAAAGVQLQTLGHSLDLEFFGTPPAGSPTWGIVGGQGIAYVTNGAGVPTGTFYNFVGNIPSGVSGSFVKIGANASIVDSSVNADNIIARPISWTYANALARTGASGFTVADVGKWALQSDYNTIWYLTNHVGPVWTQINPGGGSLSSPVSYYVDGTSGNDANDGLTWLTAKKTFTFMRVGGELPRELQETLTINVRGTVLSTDNLSHLPLKFFYGSGWIIVRGEASNVLTALAVNGYSNTATAWNYHSYITTTAAGWTPGAYRGNYVVIAGDPTYYPILDNTADTIYSINLPDLAGTDTYSIVALPIIKGALVADPGTFVTYSDEAVEVQDCSLSYIILEKLNFVFDRDLDPANWVRLGDRSYSTEISIVDCAFNTNLQMLTASSVGIARCYFDLDGGSYVDTSGSMQTLFLGCVFYAASRSGYGIYLNQNKVNVLGCRFKDQAMAINTWYNGVGGTFTTPILFEECDIGVQLGGGDISITAGSDPYLRFRNVGQGFALSGASVGIFEDVLFVPDNVTDELWLGDNSSFEFSDLGSVGVSNATMGASVYQISVATYAPVSRDEYDNTSSGLTARRYQSAIDELAASGGGVNVAVFAETAIDLVDDTDFTAVEPGLYVTAGVGYMLEVVPTTGTGNLTVILYQDVARLEPVYTMVVDLSDADTFRSAEPFGFELETDGTLYGTAFCSGVPGSQTFDINVTAGGFQPSASPPALPSPYGDGIEDDGTGKPRVAIPSDGGLQFSTGKLKLKPNGTADVYPTLSASGIAITGAVTTGTDQTLTSKKIFAAVGASRLGATGKPTSGTYSVGHEVLDDQGIKYRCTVAGTPGSWELADSVGDASADYATASLAPGISETLEIITTGDVGTFQLLQVWAVVNATADYSTDFRLRIYRTSDGYGRDVMWQASGVARQSYLTAILPAAQDYVEVNDEDMFDTDEACVIYEDDDRYELARILARSAGNMDLDEVLVDGSSWAANTKVCSVVEFENVPFRNEDGTPANRGRAFLQVRNNHAANTAIFYVRALPMSLGVLR